jgi:hypothetical protein
MVDFHEVFGHESRGYDSVLQFHFRKLSRLVLRNEIPSCQG